MSPSAQPGVQVPDGSWGRWERNDAGSFIVMKDNGRPARWTECTLVVHLHGGIEFDIPEGASPFLESPDECRYLANRLAEAAMLAEMCARGWLL